MLADQTNCVGETAITIVLSNIAPRISRTTSESASDVGGASVRVAALSETVDTPPVRDLPMSQL